ncbi:MAG: MMPL family transporter, partial [Candidatus Hydrogenedentota bacterium]
VKWRKWGLDVRKYLSSLPQSSEEVERLRQDIRLDDEVYGRLVSTDETSTLLVVRLVPDYDRRQLYQSLHTIAEKYSGPERIYPFGYQIMNEEANMGIGHDIIALGPVALVLMAVGMFTFFRSVRLTLGPILMVVISIVWTIGLMRYVGFPLSILSSSIPPLLIALGSSYAIHVIYSCTEETAAGGTPDGVVEGVRKISVPILLAAGTSMVGFATLTVFRILSIREYGICVAIGVGFAACLSLVVLSSIMVLQKGLFSAARRREFSLLDKVLDSFAHIGMRYKYVVAAVVMLVLAVSMDGILKVKVGVAPEEIFPPHHRAREVISLFVREFHGPYNLNVMFTAKDPGGLKSPDVMRQIDAFQRFGESIPKVKYSASIVDSIKRMNRILNEDAPEFYAIPADEPMVAQLMLLHSLTHDPAQFESLVDYDMQRCKVSIMTTAIDSAQLEEIYGHLATYCEQNLKDGLRADFGGRSVIWVAQNHYIIRGKIINIAANTVLIWAICALAFRSVRLGLISILPLTIATAATFGLMGHCGIRLDMATAVLTGICVGVGVDFAIHFISRLRRESLRIGQMDEAVRAAILGAGRAIVFDALSHVLGFTAFLFSGFTPIRNLGMLICFTMVSCVVLTLIFIPAIIAIVPVPFRHAKGETIFLRARMDGEKKGV